MGEILWLSLLLAITHVALGAELAYSIDEELIAGTFIGNVAEDYDLRSTMTSEEYNNLVYKILASGNSFASYFRVVNTTGQLFTTKPIDRDDLQHCDTVTCTLPLDIAVQATIGAFFRKINVDINIEDLNDNSPVFPSSFDSVEFSENSIDSSTTISGASDRDAGNNTVVRYYIETTDVPFDVTLEKYVDGSSQVRIVVTGDLDREKIDFYLIKVVAEDGGVNTKHTGTVDVSIRIIDVNDNSPEFSSPFYNITLKEDIAINTVVETIAATDADLGENGEVEYRFSANSNADIIKMFAINSTTGELSVIDQLVYIPTEQMRIYVEAYDKGSQPKVAQVAVLVNILDSKNKSPQINVNILSGDVEARVSEYANVGAVIAHIGVVDDDTGRNGKVECIGISDNFGLERYETNEYKAIVLKSLNRELKQTHEVMVVCRDNGSPPLNSTANFTVTILDENDSPPRFTQNTYFPTTEENNDVGDVVAIVKAEDADTGTNQKIKYSIISAGGYNFWMDPDSGEIRANFILDRENVTQIQIFVKAVDGGSPALTSTATVILSIADINDNYPKFSLPNYEFFVYEGVPFNTTVDQLTATDKDDGVNGTVSFSFETQPSKHFPFVLYSDGTIKMIKGLDRELQSRYEFKVIASDHGARPLSSSVTVTVVVLDLNDNAPVFVFPDDDNNTASIPLSSNPESVTIIITATDIDEGVNGALSYSIIDNNVTGLFSIESRNGVGLIKLQRIPGSSEALQYVLKILAEDSGAPKQSSIKTLTIAFIKDAVEDDSRQNFLIAVALGCVTVVLSIAIVLTICLIRRHDRLRNKDCAGCTDKADIEIVPSGSKQHVDLGSTSSGSKESLKKVSFSTDFNSTMDSDPGRDLQQAPLVDSDGSKVFDNGRYPSSTSSPRNYSSTNQHEPDMQKLDPATVLQLHRSLLQSHDKLWTNHRDGHTPPLTKEILKHHEDNGSESSGETATYDSGRGGSESDIQTSYSQSHDNDHIKTVTFANKPQLHHLPHENHWRVPNDISSSNRPYSHHNNPNKPHNPPPQHPNKLALPKRDYNSIQGPTSSHPHTSMHPKQGYNLSPISDTPNHMTSYDDDDDTTTSGSYTIDNDDWMNDSQNASRSYILSQNEAYC